MDTVSKAALADTMSESQKTTIQKKVDKFYRISQALTRDMSRIYPEWSHLLGFWNERNTKWFSDWLARTDKSSEDTGIRLLQASKELKEFMVRRTEEAVDESQKTGKTETLDAIADLVKKYLAEFS